MENSIENELISLGLPTEFGQKETTKKTQKSPKKTEKSKKKSKSKKNYKNDIKSNYIFISYTYKLSFKNSIPSIFIDNGQPVSEVFKISKSPSVSSNTNDQNEITRILTNEIIRKTDFTNNLQNCLHRMKKKKRNLPSTALSSKEATYCPKCLKNSDKNDNDFPVLIKYQTPVKTVTAENLDPKETIETVNGSTTNSVIAQKEEQYETYRNEDFDTILNGTMNPEEIGQETETEMEKRLYRNAVQICKIDNAEQLKTFNHFYTMRKDLFYRFNDGIQMDFESWFSVTPENVARHIAERLACNIIVDGFCGAGGNSIQFARTCDIVFAIDNNMERLKMAKHNAKVYGYNNIEFILGDFFEVVQNLFFDCFFASPPWGGPNYNKDITHNFNDFNGISGFKIVLEASNITKNISLLLPRTICHDQMIQVARNFKLGKCDVEHCVIGNHHKFTTVYFGDLVNA